MTIIVKMTSAKELIAGKNTLPLFLKQPTNIQMPNLETLFPLVHNIQWTIQFQRERLQPAFAINIVSTLKVQ